MTHWDDCQNCKDNHHERPGLLHVYGQEHQHDEVYLVGDEKALKLLRDAIDQALAMGLGATGVSAADGEGFNVHVVKHDPERMDKLSFPYKGWDAGEKCGRYPASLVPWTNREDEEILGDAEWFEAQRRLGTDYEK